MLFTSVTFLFYFLPLILIGYFLLPSIGLRNLFLLAASLVFYFWGEPWFVAVMALSIALNYAAGLALAGAASTRRGAALALAVAANLLILAIFKYAGFLVDSLNTVLDPLHLAFPRPEIALPLGISFFTFQAISYLVDVYRGHVPAERNPLYLGMYIAMFPQLVAGPIVRFETVARQIRDRRTTLGRASVGARIFVIGLAQKVLIANEVARIADAGFAAAHPSLLEAWAALLAYTLQIYFDFAGYSNMAIGLGLAFGFTFPRNFRLPYRSRSITEFWRRWHISLSTWFRDYLYIPLGGNRVSPLRTYVNLATVFLLCGLWHGASWSFVVWGAHHGALLILERAWLGARLRAGPALLAHAYTLLAVMAGWVWFRADDVEHALRFFFALAGGWGMGELTAAMHLAFYPTTLLALGAGMVLALLPERSRSLHGLAGALFPARSGMVVAAADTLAVFALLTLAILAVGAGSYNPFLYFRF
jgi:D-alanyl-lipoteichoic acid acyltransferase DltB (MBOAT superfamily)